MIVHCIIYTGCIGYALVTWRGQLSIFDITFTFSTHYIIDKFRIWLDAKRWWKNYEDDWLPTFVDQGLHFLVLLGIILYYR